MDYIDKYDWIGEYHQGVALVKKNERFGAIMVGGKEIVSPIYDALSDFEGGYATATYNGEERIVNLSGQIQVKKGEELVFLPEEYDWGNDYIEGICVIIKNGKFGIVDKDFQVIEKPSYQRYSGYQNGYALFEYNNMWLNDVSCIIDTKGKILYDNAKEVGQDFFVVSLPDENTLYGLIDKNLAVRIPCMYEEIWPLKENLYVAKKNKINHVINTKGEVVLTLKYGESITAKDPYFLIESSGTYRLLGSRMNEVLKIKYGERLSNIICINDYFNIVEVVSQNNTFIRHIFTVTGKEVLTHYGTINILPDHDVLYYVSTYRGLYKITKDGLFFLLKTYWDDNNSLKQSDLLTISSLTGLEVSSSYFNYSFGHFSTDRLLINDFSCGCHGLSDKTGTIIISPQYKVLVSWKNNLIIAAKELGEGNDRYLKFGIIDSNGNTILPFEYGFIGTLWPSCLLVYSLDAKLESYYFATTNAKISIIPPNRSFSYGLLDSNLKVIIKPKYNKIETFISSKSLLKVSFGKMFGVIDYKGNEIVPVKYHDVHRVNNPKGIFSVSVSIKTSFPYTTLTNLVNEKGAFVVSSSSSKDVYVSPDICDWCDKFNEDGYAKIIKNGLAGKINMGLKLISLNGTQQIEVPSNFSWAYDYKYGYVPVLMNSKWGLADSNFNLVIPCEYFIIEPLCPDFFVYQIENNSKIGLLDKNNVKLTEPNYKSIDYIEGKYFKLEKIVNNPHIDNDVYEIIDKSGHHVIPITCSSISMYTFKNIEYWVVKSKGKMGVYCGSLYVVPPIFDNVEFRDNVFVCDVYEQGYSNLNRNKRIKYSNVYDVDGELQLCIEKGIVIKIPKEYETAKYIGLGLIRVMKEDWWGIINIMNEVVATPAYSYIDNFDGSFARIGIAKDDNSPQKLFFSIDGCWHLKWGLINTSGDIVIPLEYDYIEKWDNDYYLLTKDNYRTLLSPSLHSILETNDELKKLDDRFIIAKRDLTEYTVKGLYDFKGNEIVPADEKHGFSQIEALENGFLKVTYYKGEYGGSNIAIFDCQLRKIVDIHHCDDVSLLPNGFILVESHNYGSPTTYSLFNLQGHEILPDSYYEIKFKNDGMISVRNSDGWGMADIRGNVIIEPKYLDELVFNDGIAKITVKGSSSTHRINIKGNVFVLDGKSSVELPDYVYWGTNFVNGISIVRGKGRGRDVIGVININGDMIIPTQCTCISLLSNKTIKVRRNEKMGVFDMSGQAIFPPIFSSIEYVAKDRVRVKWYSKWINRWDKFGVYISSEGREFKQDPNVVFDIVDDGKKDEENALFYNRCVLCNSYGVIVHDNGFIYIGKFVGQYACAYKKVTKNNNVVQFSNAGIINIHGKTITEPIYDKIVLYEKSLFAKVRKDGKYGIIHIPSGSIHIFEDIEIKYMWDINQYGLCIYSDECWYNDYSDKWEYSGRLGVLSIKGVVIPLGKYDNINLLNNGLIEVSNEAEDQCGLLDKDGNIILPVKYSYISKFKGQFATICLGGKRDDEWSCKVKGGKWGVIDSVGKIVKECVSDAEEVLEGKECDHIETDNQTSFEEPSVILSDGIPEPKERNSYDYGYDSYRDDDDEGPYSKYGGYNGWDDNTIDEAFDGNPELTWNID